MMAGLLLSMAVARGLAVAGPEHRALVTFGLEARMTTTSLVSWDGGETWETEVFW
jgi:hypothetical protein